MSLFYYFIISLFYYFIILLLIYNRWSGVDWCLRSGSWVWTRTRAKRTRNCGSKQSPWTCSNSCKNVPFFNPFLKKYSCALHDNKPRCPVDYSDKISLTLSHPLSLFLSHPFPPFLLSHPLSHSLTLSHPLFLCLTLSHPVSHPLSASLTVFTLVSILMLTLTLTLSNSLAQ